jgi:hypothetical protein
LDFGLRILDRKSKQYLVFRISFFIFLPHAPGAMPYARDVLTADTRHPTPETLLHLKPEFTKKIIASAGLPE